MATVSVTRRVRGEGCVCPITDAGEKLRWRAGLAGAATYDAIAGSLRVLQAGGAPAIDLLPLAMPAAWLVNSKATSRAMQRWLAPPSRDAWAAVLDVLAFELSPEQWLADAERDAITPLVAALATGEDGATLVAVTKVLALLRPQLVPLMDDAALAYALELVPVPESADQPVAAAPAFVPMLDWFAREVIANERALTELAAAHDRAVLDAAQVLDRLLWIESWGERLRAR